MMEIVSLHNRIIKEYRLLGRSRHRKKTGRVILEGVHLLREALRAGIELEAILLTPTFLNSGGKRLKEQLEGYSLYQLSDSLFKSIAQTEQPQGVGAIARISVPTVDFLWKEDDLFLLVLDRIQDPGNLGTIIRTAAAGAVDGILLLAGTADPTNPKALRAGMGGIFYLPVVHANNYPDWQNLFAERGIRLIAADPRGEVPYYALDFNGPMALLIGNESKGVSAPLLKMAAARVSIPLPGGGITSLNAAVAAAVFIFERQRCRIARS